MDTIEALELLKKQINEKGLVAFDGSSDPSFHKFISVLTDSIDYVINQAKSEK